MQKKLRFVLVALVLVMAVIVGANMLLKDNTDTPVGSDAQVGQGISMGAVVPHKVGSFDLVGLETGPEALDNINRLHGTKIDIIDGYVAQYANENSSFVLWMSESRDDKEARYLFDIMDEKMPNSPMFKNRTELDFEGRSLIYVTGAGMENYYWVEGRKNYWVGIFTGDEMEILQLVVENF
ncbi:MAG: hypothetical protein KGZ96_07825 [Clostridia bacterium]|jgi:hypothetical protein|nr:hypothetical protein [Clostridia bacterium]